MTQKSCLLRKGYSVMDNLYNKDVISRSICSRRKSKAAPCGQYVSFGTVLDWSLWKNIFTFIQSEYVAI